MPGIHQTRWVEVSAKVGTTIGWGLPGPGPYPWNPWRVPSESAETGEVSEDSPEMNFLGIFG